MHNTYLSWLYIAGAMHVSTATKRIFTNLITSLHQKLGSDLLFYTSK
jgi:hypothetical protein